jgi:hypothetical protein
LMCQHAVTLSLPRLHTCRCNTCRCRLLLPPLSSWWSRSESQSVDVKRVQRDGGVVVHLEGPVTEDPVDQHSASSSASHQLIAPHHGRCKRKLQASCVCNPNFAVIKSLLRVSPVMTPRDRQMAQALQVLDDENQSRLSGSFSGTKLRMQHAIY